MVYRAIAALRITWKWAALLITLLLLSGFLVQFLSIGKYPVLLKIQGATLPVCQITARYLPVEYWGIDFSLLFVLILFRIVHTFSDQALFLVEKSFWRRGLRPKSPAVPKEAPDRIQSTRTPASSGTPVYRSEAIAIVDLVSSTALLTQFGNTFLLSVRQRLQQQVLPISSHYGANYAENIGDGFLIFFSSVEKSVASLQEIFQKLPALNEGLPEGAEIALRATLNFGEVIVDLDSRRTGSAVYKTFRMEAVHGENLIRTEGGIKPEEFPQKNYILVSEEAMPAVLKIPGCTCQFLGICELKGFPGLHRLYRLRREAT